MPFSYFTLLAAIMPIFALLGAGFVIRRVGWLSAEADASLLRVTVNLLYPCLIADTLLRPEALLTAGTVVAPPLVGFFTVVVGYFAGLLGARGMQLGGDRSVGTFAFVVGLYNYGYIPVPIVQSFFDRATLGTLFLHNLGVEIAFWSVGVLILTAARSAKNWRKAINAPVLAIVGCVVLNLLGVSAWVPDFVLQTAHMLAAAAIPLGVLLTGATIADVAADAGWNGGLKASLSACVLRLLLLPLAFVALAVWAPFSIELKRVIVIQAAMPAAMLPVVIVKLHSGDERLALQAVLSTTIVSLLTIPFWIQLGLRLLG